MMWKAQVGHDIKLSERNNQNANDDDGDDGDWETDPNFVNDVTEEEQRWGSKTIEGSGRTAAALNMGELRVQVAQDDAELKKKMYDESGKASFGYGGKFGIEQDRMDKSALGHDHLEKVEKHASQKDYVSGFGGKYGVQTDRVDKSAVGWDYQHKLEKHESQKDYAVGFGGKFGVQKDRQDKSAVGWEHQEILSKHESQLDYSKGFGGKFGVETEKQDKSAKGWEHHEKLSKHESQIDYSKGFGGKFGVETDKQDKSAKGWDDHEKLSKHESQMDYSKGFGGRFGVETEKQDKCAKGWDEKTKVDMHPSQTDMKIGFGGKFGVQTDRVDKSAHNYQEDVEEKDTSSPSQTSQSPKVPTGGSGSKTSSLKAMFECKVKEEASVPSPSIPASSRTKTSVPNFPKTISTTAVPLLPEEKPLAKETTAPSKPARQTSPSPKANEPIESSRPVQVPVVHEEEEEFEENDFDEEEKEVAKAPATPTTPEPQIKSAPVEEDDLLDETLESSDVSAIAMYDYEAAAEDELTFDPGDLITNIEMVDEGWWRGECRGKVGLFPANYVELQQ